MDILPILSTLKRHKTAAGLIVLQIALTCAIVCNALFLIFQRIDRISADTGMAEEALITLSLSSMARVENPEPQTRADLAALAQVPGVVSAALTNQYPYGRNSNNSSVRLEAGEQARSRAVAGHYTAGPGFIATSGLKLVEGRDFLPEEFVAGSSLDNNPDPRVPAVIINKHLANVLFPGESALGKGLYVYGQQPQRVVGVLAELPSPNPGSQDDNALDTMLMPVQPSFRGGSFLIRVAPGADPEAVLKASAAKLLGNSPGLRRVVRDQDTMIKQRSAYYRQDRSMVLLLAGVCVGLLIVTAFGIVGLASFWVQQRTRMIGTRRALGATRGQILRYFQTENLLLSTAGIALGMLGAYGISLLLMSHYELPRLPLVYLPAGALVLWALGQVAVLAPARRAAALPPVAALRGG
ncbi:FtsX-like permease family protein [Mitsuaria sp. GD03876]|uniref:ABC transporter permease n=1 Tax=Mitsuaria sp. GD03876 TaxID=2975399 RepID=UPI00244B9A30|nr:FtsX-like permease family protein [Mitsuaria sp. GD03876]MDH0866206.1 ABC transporter permease [Mitsuaria sp. GD03876]